MEQLTDAYRLAVAQNVATNGRLFCILLAAANAAAACPIGVALSALPVGLAWVADVAPRKYRSNLALASVASSFGLAIATLVNCW
ncbi:hypothetical protein SAMN05428953_12663 [Mesorhizobium muleiense]|uniref:Uncharacterized protein n=1 Tax=Mesorhizobium muleiense TaxID=1004279 RepID=A0A1G9H466_9HYPH|nr:hypothetical protein [Mesorhizobium muleiense]SDL07721.1 hypothetical protein SAMN05428953_12663 [Mesorhizobium muleiense]